MSKLYSILKFLILIFFIGIFTKCEKKENIISPVQPLPNSNQVAWQKMEYYAFIHFNMNTFTNKEWGYGDEKPIQFNPSQLDTGQWAKVIKQAGMKGIIITAKHHDGFALWPSKYTDHSVKNSLWRDGKGDLIDELSKSCKDYGLKLGIYISPWDRNHPDYGKPEYVIYFRNQLRELLTQYGDIFEVWFDGANGGDGYYGGANEIRKVDKKTYYDWPKTIQIVRDLQPKAVIFSDAGPDIRWVGNEKGYANETTWSPIYRDSLYPGMPNFNDFSSGQENGTHWVPTETDVSIRPGWYYHPEEDSKVKSVSKLIDIYFNSVGLNSSLLLNLPVDKRGLIHENEIENLNQLSDYLDQTFSKNYAYKQNIEVSSSVKGFEKMNIIDGNLETYWVSRPDDVKPNFTLNFESPLEANTFMVQEYIQLGQRIQAFTFEIMSNGKWEKVYEGTTIGNKRLIRFKSKRIDAIRFSVSNFKKQVVLNNIGLYRAPLIN